VSLILEALKKLERERKTPQRGFLVTTPAAWPSRGEGGLRAAYVLAGLAVAAGVLGAWLVLGRARPRPVEAVPAPPAAALRPLPPALSLPAPATSLRRFPGSSPPPSSTPPAAAAPAATLAAAATEAAPPAELASERPEDAPPPSGPTELSLQAISRKDGKPVAVLSGRLVYEGDAFDNVRVVRIGEAEVEVEVDGQRRVLGF